MTIRLVCVICNASRDPDTVFVGKCQYCDLLICPNCSPKHEKSCYIKWFSYISTECQEREKAIWHQLWIEETYNVNEEGRDQGEWNMYDKPVDYQFYAKGF